METKELKITIPEGFEIDKENSSFEKIVFKKKNIKPRSWKEYCKQQVITGKRGYFIRNESDSTMCNWIRMHDPKVWRNVLPSKELAEAFLAMMQLVSLRQAWVGDWKPVWNDSSVKWCTVSEEDEIVVDYFYSDAHSLSFPTYEMAEEFLNCFKDLLEIAKPLI